MVWTLIDEESRIDFKKRPFHFFYSSRSFKWFLRHRFLCTSTRLTLGALACCLLLAFASFSALPATKDDVSVASCDCGRDCRHHFITGSGKADDATAAALFASGHKLAVIVPFRDRFDELTEFVPYMCVFLESQGINFEIFVINQIDGHRFNRAALINVGFHLSSPDTDYIAMHDVDLLPLNRNLSYAFPSDGVFHVAAPGLHPLYGYKTFVGGILLVTKKAFKSVNGLSNLFWGWGREDDDFYLRLKSAGLPIRRPDPSKISTGRKNTFRHIHGTNRKRDQIRYDQQKALSRQMDVVTGLDNVTYELVKVQTIRIDEASATVLHVRLECDYARTPWCDHLLSEDEIAAVLGRQKRERQDRKRRKTQSEAAKSKISNVL